MKVKLKFNHPIFYLGLSLLLCFGKEKTLNAQQIEQFTQYMFNPLIVNPAYAGTRDALSMALIHRHQWVGIKGAPVTQSLTAHTPILKDKLGIGLSVINDQIGPLRQTSIYTDIAYHLNLGKGKFSFGLKGGLNLFQSTIDRLKLRDQADAFFKNGIESILLPNFGVGTYYHTDKYYVGLSVPKLLENGSAGTTNESKLNFKQKRHFFLTGGYVMDISPSVVFKPSGLIKFIETTPTSIDLNASFLFSEKVWAGLNYRVDDAVGLTFQFLFNENFRVGYAYDFTTSNLGTYNSGSHEFMLSYDLEYKKSKIKSPRYF